MPLSLPFYFHIHILLVWFFSGSCCWGQWPNFMTVWTWCSFRTTYVETESQEWPEEQTVGLLRDSRGELVFHMLRNLVLSYHSDFSSIYLRGHLDFRRWTRRHWTWWLKALFKSEHLVNSSFFFGQIGTKYRVTFRKLFGIRSQWLFKSSFPSFLLTVNRESPW